MINVSNGQRNRTSLFSSAVSVIVLVTWVALSVDSAAAGDASDQDSPASASGELVILPSSLITHPDYPAHFIVLQRLENGTARQVGAVDGLEVQIEDDSVASIDDGTVRASRVFARAAGRTRISARLGSLRASAPVECVVPEERTPNFRHDVSAVFSKVGCNAGTCHGNLHGKGGFRLSLRGDTPQFDYASITRLQGGRRIDWFEPTASLLLRKPAGELTHRGGVRLSKDSLGYDLIRRWIAAGAPAGIDESLPMRVRKLSVFPDTATLSPEDRSQCIVVTAELDDGTLRDVTPWARYESSVVSGVEISADGWIRAERPMDVSISASYLDAKAQTRLVFLQRLPAREIETTASPAQPIDRLVDERLRRMGLEPRPSVSPERFLRRLYLTTAGRLPTSDEFREFLATPAETRRARWVDRVLFDPGYADLWALHWSDLLRNEQKVMSPQGARGWNAWIRDQFAADVPLTTFVRESIATVGSTLQSPAASFHRTHREPEIAAEALGQVFLGIRIQCARCHNHPFDQWKQDDYYGLAAYFTTVERKAIENQPRDELDKHVITGDEVISLADRAPRIRHPGRASDVGPKPIDQPWASPPDTDAPAGASQAADPGAAGASPLDSLADWLTGDNRAFARNMANRVWFHTMGRGIVDPPDDFRSSNPPSNPELLEYVTDRLIASGYSTRALMREILLSDTFARESISQSAPIDTLDGAPVFAGFPLRRMPAEVLLDAISDVCGVASAQRLPEEDQPRVDRAVRLAGVPRDGFLRTFGKPDRLLSCECERSAAASLSQSLQMLNGDEIRGKLTEHPNRIEQWLSASGAAAGLSDSGAAAGIVEEMYLTVLTRFPSPEEDLAMRQYLSQAEDPRAAAEDILWALINSQEFPWIR